VNDILAKLNDAQLGAVTAPDGPVLVVAGAGSGKTRVLTTRVAWLLGERGVHPGAILAFTFTNRAAREMKERVAGSVGEGRAPFWIGTFHATGLRILRSDGAAIGVPSDFSIFDTDDSKRLIKQVLDELKIDAKQFTPSGARSMISSWKNDDVDPVAAAARATTFVEEKNAAIYGGYEKGLVRCKALDFDDLILRTVHLLEQDAGVRLKYAERFHHVLVDEFQDTNPLQLVLIKALQSEHGNLFAVGDDDQSIYSWRGARIENMLAFDDFFPGAVTCRLEQNYRSTGTILDAANAVIAHNQRRKGKNLWTAGDRGEQLVEEEFLDGEDEAARLVDIVRAEITRGLTRADVTVLYRTNAQSRVLEDALRRAHLPYQIVGSLQFYERKEVRDVLAYLKFIANPADEISLQRVINVPKRQLGDTTVARLLALANNAGLTCGEAAAEHGLLESEMSGAVCRRVRTFFDQAARWRRLAAEAMPLPELLQQVLKDIAYQEHLESDDPESAAQRAENVAELVNAAADFHEASAGGSLGQFLEQTALVSDPDTIRDGEGQVRLMTIHTAKGLEFPVVVLAGCEDDILPHINSAMDEAGLEEERRLFYVALTRAEKRIYLLHAMRRRRFGTWQDALPSRFLREVPDALVERRRLNLGYGAGAGAGMTRSLFGGSGSGGGGSKGGGAHSREPVRPSTWSGGSSRNWTGSGGGAQGTSASRRVSPGEWGSSNRPRGGGRPGPGAEGGSDETRQHSWDDDVQQQAPYFEGQAVSHGIFGSGTVARVEGTGDDLQVTVDFPDYGRKHLNPKFAPLVPID
jgi:DNA helicase-2/ATP-dependent DNA helicase PcrA